MTTRILISGVNPFRSGKTTFTIQLGRFLQEQGINPEYFKPISGHSYWFHHDHTKDCIEQGELFSLDARRVRDELGSSFPVTVTNPVHRMFAPAIIDKPGNLPFTSLALAGWDSVLVLQRFTKDNDGKPQSSVVAATELIENGTTVMKSDTMESLTQNCEIVPISSLKEVRQYEQQHFESCVESCFQAIESKADVVIIESFNNSIWPWEQLKKVDQVFVVGPAQAFEYDPEKFSKAAFLMKRGNEPLREVTMNRVDDLLTPVERVDLLPNKGLNAEDLHRISIVTRKD
ncbi:MAG: hypothetical protein GF309_09800 [Candidatus Lokiarchaeota archaeon]|nr:hypothetical protein [Candidatus Lokiarchaeota archaeon]